MSDDWDQIGFVISSQYRVTVLDRLSESPATPSQIASDESVGIASVSHALSSLRERGLVNLLVSEDRRKGRVYGITEDGAEIWEEITRQGLADDPNRG